MYGRHSTSPSPEHSLALPLIVALLGLLLASTLAAQTDYQVVVNSSNPIETISKADLSKLLLKKVSKWEHGLRVQPIDQSASRPVRAIFSRDVHGRGISSIKAFWQKMIFSGRGTPPIELASDTEILQYLRSNSGAISYVSAGVSLGPGVKVLRITE